LQSSLRTTPVLNVENLKVHFPINRGVFLREVGRVKAVDGINFKMQSGEILGIVGESGCGKSTALRALLNLIPATEGNIEFNKANIRTCSKSQLRQLRKKMQIVFQDPFASLNPRMTVGQLLCEPYKLHGIGPNKIRRENALKLLDQVGLNEDHFFRYPHEFSGGQRQRIAIARALTLKPELLCCDEPVSALDVSVQSQILNLLKKLQKEFLLTILFISHDLAVVKYFCENVHVMYLGRFVESQSTTGLFKNPRHPYTQSLISAIPRPKPGQQKKRIILEGDVPNPANIPEGCCFHPRCFQATEICKQQVPREQFFPDGSMVACHHAEQ
jgi:oligopeptide transport system ATP-binding protein